MAATRVLWIVSLSSLWGLNAITIKAVVTDMAPLLAAGLDGGLGGRPDAGPAPPCA